MESLQEQNQVILNASFASADGLTVMCSFNGTLQPCTSPYLVDVTYLCTGRYPLVLVGICNGREVTRMESTIRRELHLHHVCMRGGINEGLAVCIVFMHIGGVSAPATVPTACVSDVGTVPFNCSHTCA